MHPATIPSGVSGQILAFHRPPPAPNSSFTVNSELSTVYGPVTAQPFTSAGGTVGVLYQPPLPQQSRGSGQNSA
jgi:hypothetical protein